MSRDSDGARTVVREAEQHPESDRTRQMPAIVVIGGEAGVGETCLASEVLPGLTEDRILQGGCLELG